jgi:hypothetical protein
MSKSINPPPEDKNWDGDTYNKPGVLTGPAFGGNCTLEAKRRELRDSETFSSRGEMFTNMSLGKEKRSNPALVFSKSEEDPTVVPLHSSSQHRNSQQIPSICPCHSHLSTATQRVL